VPVAQAYMSATIACSVPFAFIIGSASSPVAVTLFHGELHTLATTAGKIIIYTLATTLSSSKSSGIQKLARSSSGKAPLEGQDPHGEDAPDIDEVLSQLEQLVDLLEQYFHPSNNGRYALYAQTLNPKQSTLRVQRELQLIINGFEVASAFVCSQPCCSTSTCVSTSHAAGAA